MGNFYQAFKTPVGGVSADQVFAGAKDDVKGGSGSTDRLTVWLNVIAISGTWTFNADTQYSSGTGGAVPLASKSTFTSTGLMLIALTPFANGKVVSLSAPGMGIQIPDQIDFQLIAGPGTIEAEVYVATARRF